MPELRRTANGAPVTNFSLATNRIWRDQNYSGSKNLHSQGASVR
jgi:single-stranded DNA-binding protein